MKQQQKQQQATPRRPDRSSPGSLADFGDVIDVEQAEAALVEHYPRLVRLAYLVLPSGQGRGRRVLAAHGVVQRTLPRQRSSTHGAGLPAPRTGADAAIDPGYAFVRLRVLRAALVERTDPPVAAAAAAAPPGVGPAALPALRRRR